MSKCRECGTTISQGKHYCDECHARVKSQLAQRKALASQGISVGNAEWAIQAAQWIAEDEAR